jgi:hypothetical protein
VRTVTIKPTQPQADFHALTCKHPAFIGGFGTGKSETMANQAFMDASHSSSALIGLYEPTYDLVRLIMAPRIEEKLQQYGIRYRYNKSENIIYSSNAQFGDFVLRTLDNPSRIIGYETYRAHVDEIDTLKEAKAREAWNKIIARNRQSPAGITNPFNRVSAYSTPEGFKFVYKAWKKDVKRGYEMIQAATTSNPFLPADYVETLRETYPQQLIAAYIEGQFVNLTTGTVYSEFDRVVNNTDVIWDGAEPLHVGMDFNVCNMSAVISVIRNSICYDVNEITGGYDTPSMINSLKERFQQCQINIYPDASGKNRNAQGASESSVQLLRSAGFQVFAKNKNPFVKDRVLAMNTSFTKRLHFVNVKLCPTHAANLEQQVYNNAGEPDKTAGNDHTNDANGYLIHYKYPVIKPTTTAARMIV